MNRTIGLLLTLGLLGAGFLAAQDSTSADNLERVYVYIKDQARTPRDQMRLGDVASVQGFDEALVAQVNDLPLGPAPLPGNDILLDRESIRRSLAAHRIDPVRVSFSGSDAVRVSRSGRKITGAEMAGLIQDYVHRSWQGLADSTAVTYSNLPDEIVVEEGNSQLQVLDQIRGRVSGAAAVSLAVIEDGRVVRRVPVSIRAQAFGTVAVAIRDLHQGEFLQPGDIQLATREISDQRSEAVSSLEQAAGMRLRRNVRQDQPLTVDALENPPVVDRGDEVTLIVQYKNIRIGCPGKAWESGGRGDKILVRNHYGRNMTGRVVDSRTVLITDERMGDR
ncbi:flagellar basal body P-ring formation chaperone FlgA [bacterium]|nr:flagellar basal body P-ring formation chaperone FlgA [bacterium]